MGYGDRSGGRPDRVDAGYKLNEEAAPVPKVERGSGTRSNKRDDYIMDDFLTISISNTISKDSVDEEMSLIRATMEDAENRLTEGIRQESISRCKGKDSR